MCGAVLGGSVVVVEVVVGPISSSVSVALGIGLVGDEGTSSSESSPK